MRSTFAQQPMKYIREIAHGAFGRVDRVQMADGTPAARKTLDPTPEVLRWSSEQKLRQRFEPEVKVRGALDSSFGGPVIATDRVGRELWFAMCLAGRNFQAKLN